MQFFHIRRGCLGGQPRHMVGAVCLGAGDSLWCRFSLPGWGRVRVGRGPEGDFGVVFSPLRWERMRAEAGAIRVGESRNAV